MKGTAGEKGQIKRHNIYYNRQTL